MGSFWLTGVSNMVAPCWTGVQDQSCSTILARLTTLYVFLYVRSRTPYLSLHGGSCGGCLTGFGGPLTSPICMIDHLIFLIIQSVTGSVTIYNIRKVVLDYEELLAYWFI
jgi:hypothetical protein